MYPSYGYGGYGGYGYGSSIPYMNGGYGIGAVPVQTAPTHSTPLTPYERTNGRLNEVSHTKDGMAKGGIFGALAGGVTGAAIGFACGGPVGAAVGGLIGVIGGGLLGGITGDKVSGYEASVNDGRDDGKINGSSGEGGQGSLLGIF
jgi:phage tail tape-measure protein